MTRKFTWQKWWPIGAIGLVGLLFFWNYFLLDETLYAGDTAFVLLPFRYYTNHFLQQGLLPLWNPNLFGGTPALAEAQYQVFYPPNLILLVVGVARGHGWLLAFHLVWMALGTYLFAQRSFGLDKPSALLAALAFAFGGCTQSRLAVGVFTEAAAWLPWLLLWYDTARQNPAKWWLPALAFCLQLLTGAPQYAYYSLALLFAYHLLRTTSRDVRTQSSPSTHKTNSWLILLATPVTGALIGAAQLIPQWELAGLSNRSTRASYEYGTAFSLEPEHWLTTTVLPKFYGLFSSATRDGFFPGEETGYIGMAALVLMGAALGAAFFSKNNASTRRITIFWLIVAALSLFFAFGSYNPLYPLAFKWLPGIAMVRAPARWLLITSFCGAMLAALGFHALRNHLEARRGALIGAMTMASLCGIFVLQRNFSNPSPNAFDGWWALGAVVVAATLCAVLLRQTPTLRRFTTAGILLLATADLWWLSLDMEVQQTLPVAAVERPSQTAQLLSQPPSPGSPPPRFWAGKLQIPLESWQMSDSSTPPTDFRNQGALLVQSMMPSCVAAQYQAPGLTGAWGALMPLRRHAKPVYETKTPVETQQRWLRLLGVRHYLSVKQVEREGLSLKISEPLFVYEDDHAMPRAWWTGNAQNVTPDQAIDAISNSRFDPRNEVLVESKNLNSNTSGTSPFVPANFLEYSDHSILAEVTAPTRGYFVMMDSIYPGWNAWVNEQPAQIEPANWVGRGVAVDRGTHKVRMHFNPQSVRIGIFVSLLMLSLISSFIVFSRSQWRDKHRV